MYNAMENIAILIPIPLTRPTILLNSRSRLKCPLYI